MITLIIIIGLIIFSFKIILLLIQAAWSITKGIFAILAMPVVLLILIFAGLATVALPIIIVGIILAFLIPAIKG